MKNSLILILFLSILLSQHHDHGHDHIHGKISGLLLNDATGSPVEYATISVFKSEQNLIILDHPIDHIQDEIEEQQHEQIEVLPFNIQ